MMQIGGQNEFGSIRKILIKHPLQAMISQRVIDDQWESLNYSSAPRFDLACEEYERFVEILGTVVPEILFLPDNPATGVDSIYTRDALLCTDGGMILCNMGKPARQGEPAASGEFLRSQELPILGEISGEGRLEGGDVIFLDAHTLVVGRGYRTNQAGIDQLRRMTSEYVDKIIEVPLPHWEGDQDVFHLMSMISPLDHDLVAVYSRLLPVPFRELLLDRGFGLVEIPDDEFRSMGCNILALAPRKVLMLDRNNQTRKGLEAAGVDVLTYKGDEISRKGEGGPTCLTRPLLRLGT